MISTRGRYAIRVLLDLAEHRNGEYIPMKEVASRQNISLKYIERIMPLLTKSHLAEGIHGKGGGYRLCRDPQDCTVGEILRLTEIDLAPVSCLGHDAPQCTRAAECRTLPMWKEYYDMTNAYFDGITLASLMQTEMPDNYVI